MQQNYQSFIERVIERYEGSYGWNRNDPGGPTKFGVTCYDLAEFLHTKMDSMARWAPIVRAMSLTTAEEIYADKYATACDFNGLHSGADSVVLDFGINSGPSRSIRYAQIVVRVTPDGILGPVTLKAINDYEPRLFINELCDARINFLRGLHTWDTFGVGWSARVQDLRAYSLNLAYPPKKAPLEGYVAKIERIPLAYAKAYDTEELKALMQWELR